MPRVTSFVYVRVQSDSRLAKVNHFLATCKRTQQPVIKLFTELGFKIMTPKPSAAAAQDVQLLYVRDTGI